MALSVPSFFAIFTLTSTLLAKLECCQQRFLKNVFYVPKFASKQLLLKLSSLKSIESEIALRRLLFLGRLLSGGKMAPVVHELFQIRTTNIVLLGVLLSICKALHKYDIFNQFDSWYHDSRLQTYRVSQNKLPFLNENNSGKI